MHARWETFKKKKQEQFLKENTLMPHDLTPDETPKYGLSIYDTSVYVVIDYIADKNATVVRATSGDYVATGSSKRHTGDVSNPDTGLRLALARALCNLSKQIEADANIT